VQQKLMKIAAAEAKTVQIDASASMTDGVVDIRAVRDIYQR